MQWIDGSDSLKKESILSILIKMVKADGIMTAFEYRYLSVLARKWEIGDQQLSALIKVPLPDPMIPRSEQDRMTIMFYLLFLTKADQQIHRSEESMIYHYGFKLGFRESLLRDFIVVIKQYRASVVPPNRLVEVVKKYLN